MPLYCATLGNQLVADSFEYALNALGVNKRPSRATSAASDCSWMRNSRAAGAAARRFGDEPLS